MKKEYKVELTYEQMQIAIDALQYYAYCCKTENENELKELFEATGKLMYKTHKIYEKESQRS